MIFRNRKRPYPLYETTKFRDFREMVENATDRFPNRPAFRYKDKPTDKETKTVSFSACRKTVRALAAEAHVRGYAGQKIAMIGAASVEWFLTYFALPIAGVITVPIDRELPVADAASILNTAECSCVFYGGAQRKKIEELRALVPSLRDFVEFGDAADFAESFADFCAAGERAIAEPAVIDWYERHEIDIDSVSSIVFTSGTTGKGKGVMLSQRNICADMECAMYYFQITRRTMFVLPPHHTFGSTVNLVGHFAQGSEICISAGLRYIPSELKEYQPTHLILVPLFVETFYKRILATAEKEGKLKTLRRMIRISDALRKVGIDLRPLLFRSVRASFGGKLHMIICGGAALNQAIIDFFESIGIVILNGYGITECAPLISCNRNECRRPGSVGRPIAEGQVRILSPDENGEGEICYKGPNVMLGYYRNEEATREVFTEDGWFRTGDLGRIEEDRGDSWIYITGRSKNLIILSNGKNVYPEEIESDIGQIYGVSEAVVYEGESKSDPDLELIVAEIFPDAEALMRRGIDDPQKYFEEEVRKINAKNAGYKAVGRVKLRLEEFLKNTSRKIIRYRIDRTVD